jgi:hypothetical protein
MKVLLRRAPCDFASAGKPWSETILYQAWFRR